MAGRVRYAAPFVCCLCHRPINRWEWVQTQWKVFAEGDGEYPPNSLMHEDCMERWNRMADQMIALLGTD